MARMWLTGGSRIRLARAREVLAADAGSTVSIEHLAHQFGFSPFHFMRRFEAAFGTTPHQFRIRRRIDRAKALLAAGDSVTEACMAVGYSSLGSFSAAFTRVAGETPSAYRRRMRVLVAVHGFEPVLFPGCLTLLAQLPPSAFRSFREASSPALMDDGACASR
jgi:AraC-like DNA-binding protein